MAEPNTCTAGALLPSTTTATKRSSDTDASANKRQKTTQQDDQKKIYDLCIVAMKHKGTFVAQVPLPNFQRFHPEKVKDLVEISETNNDCWRFFYYDASALCTRSAVNDWASWLEHWDLRALVKNAVHISNASSDADVLGDTDYRHALVDAWMEWIQEGQCQGSLSVDRLRCKGFYTSTMTLVEVHSFLDELGRALILHHDAEAGMADDRNKVQYYRSSTHTLVRRLAQEYFSRLEKEPKDPLLLSAEDFCKK
ncbi:hypothetical protein KCU78_g7689, partial [Aureobasidium melanogenum]